MLKNSLASAGDTRNKSLILGSRRSPGEGNDKPLQYSFLENSMGRGAWWATVHGVAVRHAQALYYHRGQIFTALVYLDKASCGYLQSKNW